MGPPILSARGAFKDFSILVKVSRSGGVVPASPEKGALLRQWQEYV